MKTNGVKATLEALAFAFARETGHKLAIEFGLANASAAVFEAKGQEPA
jgi:hypothetical protein